MQEHLALIRQLNIRPFLVRSNVQAAWLVMVNYAILLFAIVLPAIAPHWLSIIVSLILLGNRQLGLGILMHDCAHHALFKSTRLNEWVGEWLCAAPIFAQYKGYQQYHLQHHANAGTTHDPDYVNYAPYPVKRSSVIRKFGRDIVGITGVKNFIAVMLMHAGVLQYDMAYKSTDKKQSVNTLNVMNNLVRNLYRTVIVHGVFLGLCILTGHVYLYGLWWLAYLTTFSLFSRIRNAAEHASVPDLLDADPRKHARTVKAGWLARITVAPNHVNYHIEHHWLPQVPPYHLAKLHQYLADNDALQGAEVLPSYSAVVRKLA